MYVYVGDKMSYIKLEKASLDWDVLESWKDQDCKLSLSSWKDFTNCELYGRDRWFS